MSGTEVPTLAPRSIVRIQQNKAFRADPTHWVLHSSRTLSWSQTDVTFELAVPLEFPLHVPRGATLTAVNMRIIGAGGHADDASGHIAISRLPTLSVRAMRSGVPEVLASAQDTSATSAAYQAVHDLAVSLSYDVAPTGERLVAVLGGEYGTGAVVGLRQICCVVTYTAHELEDL